MRKHQRSTAAQVLRHIRIASACAVPRPDPRPSYQIPAPGPHALLQSMPPSRHPDEPQRVARCDAAGPSVFNGGYVIGTRAADKTGNSSYVHPERRAGRKTGTATVTQHFDGGLTSVPCSVAAQSRRIGKWFRCKR
jgi:hypothetical protein